MGAQHTPGPWAVEVTPEGFVEVNSVSAPKSYRRVARFSGARHRDANAALCAAAPEMLSVLKAVEESFLADDSYPLLLEGVRAAIARAEGRT